ncbi:hypothetical protein PMAYCL1PPCAC_24855, partial [Pristionchus mayeri]
NSNLRLIDYIFPIQQQSTPIRSIFESYQSLFLNDVFSGIGIDESDHEIHINAPLLQLVSHSAEVRRETIVYFLSRYLYSPWKSSHFDLWRVSAIFIQSGNIFELESNDSVWRCALIFFSIIKFLGRRHPILKTRML